MTSVELSTTVACVAGYGRVTDLLTEICEPPIDGDRVESQYQPARWLFFSVNDTRDGQHHQNDNHHDDDLDKEGERIVPTHHPTVSEPRRN